MALILVDTSVWIGFFNQKKNLPVEKLDQLLENGSTVCVCPTIIQEILQGISDAKTFDSIKTHLLRQIVLKCEVTEAAIESAKIFVSLRKKGITIRGSSDCLIAYHALFYDAALLHMDKDFNHIASHIGLKVF